MLKLNGCLGVIILMTGICIESTQVLAGGVNLPVGASSESPPDLTMQEREKMLEISSNKDLLTLKLVNAPLAETFELLAAETEIEVWVAESLANATITLEISAPLDMALEDLLRGYNYIIGYNGKNPKARITTVSVLSVNHNPNTKFSFLEPEMPTIGPLQEINLRERIDALSLESIPEEVRAALIAATRPTDPELMQSALDSQDEALEALMKAIKANQGEDSEILSQIRSKLKKAAPGE